MYLKFFETNFEKFVLNCLKRILKSSSYCTKVANKKEKLYDDVIRFIKCKLSFLIIKLSLLCIIQGFTKQLW